MTELLFVVLGSGLVSALAGGWMKFRFDRRMLDMTKRSDLALQGAIRELEQRHKLELEAVQRTNEMVSAVFKEEIAYRSRSLAATSERRRRVYPPLEAALYRLQRSINDLIDRPIVARPAVDGLAGMLEKVQEQLYEFRLDLESDDVFLDVHAFKNLLKTIIDRLADIAALRNSGGDVDSRIIELHESVNLMNSRHTDIVALLGALAAGPTSQLGLSPSG